MGGGAGIPCQINVDETSYKINVTMLDNNYTIATLYVTHYPLDHTCCAHKTLFCMCIV